jgi:hypothetical protein
MKALIVYEMCEQIIIYEAELTDAEELRLELLHNRFGGTAGMKPEDDEFLGNIEKSIGNIRRIFDSNSSDPELAGPILTTTATRIYITGFET